MFCDQCLGLLLLVLPSSPSARISTTSRSMRPALSWPDFNDGEGGPRVIESSGTQNYMVLCYSGIEKSELSHTTHVPSIEHAVRGKLRNFRSSKRNICSTCRAVTEEVVYRTIDRCFDMQLHIFSWKPCRHHHERNTGSNYYFLYIFGIYFERRECCI